MALKKVIRIILIVLGLLVAVTAGALIRLEIRTGRILTDYASIFENENYGTPVCVEGVEAITMDVSCGYACIEMFSAWNGGHLTEEDLYNEYGRVVTSTGDRFSEEISVEEFLRRTSFEAFENMPLYLRLAFAVGVFEKNTIFTVVRTNGR